MIVVLFENTFKTCGNPISSNSSLELVSKGDLFVGLFLAYSQNMSTIISQHKQYELFSSIYNIDKYKIDK